MSKQQVIDAICKRNRSARPEFLARFDDDALRDYLQRLTTVLGRRGRGSVWVRQGQCPAVSTRVPTRAA
ncbi:MAG: hypothetical protein AAF750_17045 [Planctomycetota bacterium]